MTELAATIRFGTRGSALARAQTDLVIARLRALHPELAAHPVVIRTEGDRDQATSLTVIGGRGVFTSALQDALRQRRIDAAVHSAKDLPTDRPSDLSLVAFLAREDARDVFVSRHGCPLSELAPYPVVGTSSRRRAVQVRRLRPDARIVDLRGNVDTRLRKALESDLDGIVLAAAGVHRMGWSDRISAYLPLEIAVPSPGQGALAVEIRSDEGGPARRLDEINESVVSDAVGVERAFLRGTGGGCTTPVGAHAVVEGNEVRLLAMLASDDGTRVEWIDVRLDRDGAEEEAYRRAAELVREVNRAPHIAPRVLDREERPLAGQRVLVTRGSTDDLLSTLIAERGGVPVVLPTTRIEGPADPAALDRAVRRLVAGAYDWVVFTSKNAVAQVAARLHAAEPLPGRVQVAAVGGATATRLEEHGVRVDVVPPAFTGEALVEALARSGVRGAAVLFPRGNLARETVPAGLEKAGALVHAVEAYRTVPVDSLDPDVLRDLRAAPVDVAVFLSPSSVTTLHTLLGDFAELLASAVIACIGPVTAETARAAGLTVHVEPTVSTIPATVAAIERHLADRADVVAGSA